MSRNLIGKPHHGSGRAVSRCIYRSTGLAAPTHNGIWQCDGPSLVLLGEPTAPPSPDRDVAAVRTLALRHPIPRHPAPYGLPPKRAKAQEPRARTALGVLSPQCFPSWALPAPHSGAYNYFVGERVSSKKPSLVYFLLSRAPALICCNGGLAICSTMAQPSAKSAFTNVA